MPEDGSANAAVKFLTTASCQAYLDATKNGIEIQGDTKKTIIFVDMQAEPSSINDVIQNCIDKDVTRCIRAIGADDDWSNSALFKLARGKQSTRRVVDGVRQGKTEQGVSGVVFVTPNYLQLTNCSIITLIFVLATSTMPSTSSGTS